jgi:hypothetical protein
LVLVRSRNWKNNRFRWFGRAPSVLINHRKCLVSSDKWSIQKASNHRKGLNAQKRKLVLSHEPDVRIRCNDEKFKPPKARVRGDDTRSWGSPKGSKHLRIIHCIIISKSAPSGDSQIRLHGASLLPSGRYIHHY